MTDAAIQDGRYCLSCRHSLRGLVNRMCPECGREFDPGDPRTTSPHPHRDVWVSLAASAHGLIIAGAIGVAITALLSMLAWWDAPFLLAIAVLISPGILFVFLIVACPAAPLTRRVRIWGVVLPLLFLSIVWTHWPLAITFTLHRPLMERIAADVSAGGTVVVPRRVGLFRFLAVRTYDGNVGFQLTGHPGSGMFLVRHDAASLWVWDGPDWEIPLGGGWYYVHED